MEPIVSLQELKGQLSLTSDQQDDDPLIAGKIDAAQDHVERLLGYRIRVRYDDETLRPVPPALKEAVLQLATWWFENREAATDMSRELPFGVREIVNEYRDWTF